MKRLLAVLALISMAGLAVVMGAGPAEASGASGAKDYTCTGGSIPGGNYRSITIAGACTVDAGNVNVRRDITVKQDAALFAAFGGSAINVRGNLIVGSNGILVLGCLPNVFPCLDDPDQEAGTFSSHSTIGGSLLAFNALSLITHNNEIDDNFIVAGSTGGTCDPVDALQGAPAYFTTEDTSIGGFALIAGVKTCWMGFIRNHVGGSVGYVNNVTEDPDGNEVVTNTIDKFLVCLGNDPAPQIGDSEGGLNSAQRGFGQCEAIVAPTDGGGGHGHGHDDQGEDQD